MRRRVFSVFFTLGALLLSGSAAAAAHPRIAVLGVESRDQGDARSQQRTAALARALTDGLRSRVTQSAGSYEMAPNSQKDLMELKLLSDCLDEAPDCMAAIGRDLGADLVLYGHIEKQQDGGYTVFLRSISVGTRRPGDLSLDRALAAAEATDDGMKKLAPLVFPAEAAPAAPVHDTALIVETNIGEGQIYVNGALRGVVTAKKVAVIRGLPPGNVRLAIEAPGYRRAELSVEIRAGQAARATLTLEPQGSARVAAAPAIAPPLPREPEDEPPHAGRSGGTARVLFWTTLVATGAGVAAFTITGLKVRSIEKEQDDAIAKFNYQANGVQFPADACREAANDGNLALVDICDRGRSMATLTNVLIGATAVAAVATAIFYWRGYLASESQPREARARRKQSSGMFVVSPELYRNGGGMSAVIQF